MNRISTILNSLWTKYRFSRRAWRTFLRILAKAMKKPWWKFIAIALSLALIPVIPLYPVKSLLTICGIVMGGVIHCLLSRMKDKGEFIFRDSKYIYRHPSKSFIEINAIVDTVHIIAPATENDLDAMVEIAKENYYGTIREIIGVKEEHETREMFGSYIERNADSIFLIFESDANGNKVRLLGFTVITPMNAKRWEMYKNGKISNRTMSFENILGSHSTQKAVGLLLHSLAYPVSKSCSREEKMAAGDILQECLATHLSVLMEKWFNDSDDTVSLMYSCNDKQFNNFFKEYNTITKGESLEGGLITVVESKAAALKVA